MNANLTLNKSVNFKSILLSTLTTLLFSLIALYKCSAQQYFSKHIDVGKTGLQDNVSSMIKDKDTLYVASFNATDVSDTFYRESIRLCKMNTNADLIDCILLNGVDPNFRRGTISQDSNYLYIVDGTCCWEDAHMNIHKVSKSPLDSIQTYSYSLEKDSILSYADTDIEQTENYFYLSGWARIKDSIGINSQDFLMWIDKKTMELDTVMYLPFNSLSNLYSELFVDKNGMLTAYYEITRIPGPPYISTRGFIKYNEEKEVVFFYRDTLDTRQNVFDPVSSNGLVLKNGNMVNTQAYKGSPPVGAFHQSDYDMVCISESGNLLWRYNTPGYSPYGRKAIFNMSETKDGDILGCGWIQWYKGLKEDVFESPESDVKYTAPYIIKINGETGEEMWEYALIDYDKYGNQAPFYLTVLLELDDGTLFGGGSYLIQDSNGHSNNLPDIEDSWFITLPPDGCHFEDGCGLETFTTGTNDFIPVAIGQNELFHVFPNPSYDYINIESKKGHGSFTCKLFNMNGQVIMKDITNFTLSTLNISNIPKGPYVLRIYKENKNVHNEIIIKELYYLYRSLWSRSFYLPKIEWTSLSTHGCRRSNLVC